MKLVENWTSKASKRSYHTKLTLENGASFLSEYEYKDVLHTWKLTVSTHTIHTGTTTETERISPLITEQTVILEASIKMICKIQPTTK